MAVVAAVPVGLLACAILLVNNLRDVESDAASGNSARLHEYTKSPAVTGAPLDHFASALKWNVYRSPSGDSSHRSAAAGKIA